MWGKHTYVCRDKHHYSTPQIWALWQLGQTHVSFQWRYQHTHWRSEIVYCVAFLFCQKVSSQLKKYIFLLISGTQVNTPIFRLTVNRYVFLIVGSLLHLVLFNPKYVAANSWEIYSLMSVCLLKLTIFWRQTKYLLAPLVQQQLQKRNNKSNKETAIYRFLLRLCFCWERHTNPPQWPQRCSCHICL